MGSDAAERERYSSGTRRHYQDHHVASEYSARLRTSTTDRVLTWLEVRAVRHALDRLPGSPWTRVVDVPAGTGKLISLLASRSATYFALDISPAMMSFIELNPVRVVADAEHLPLRPATVEVVVCLRLLHRVPRQVFDAVVADTMRTASAGCVISYAGAARSPRAHQLLRRILRRRPYPRHDRAPEEVARLARAHGGHVVFDRSVSFGVTSERVAAVACTG